MSTDNKRPPIPSLLTIDKSDKVSGNICSLLNQAIKRAHRSGPVDDMRLIMNQAVRALSNIDPNAINQDQLNSWQEILQQLEVYYSYLEERRPQQFDDPTTPKSWSTSWSGRDDDGII